MCRISRRMTEPVWVVGASGLLGSAVRRLLAENSVPVFHRSVTWDQPEVAATQLVNSVRGYAQLTKNPVIIWCAGAGIPSSPAAVFDAETLVFRAFLAALSDLPTGLLGRTRIFFASSGGGVYAGAENPPYDENSEPRPLAPYGFAKLAREHDLELFCHQTGARSISGRISNLYGPGQDLRKTQGLISTLLMGFLTHTPTQIYVSLDTVRDYLYVSDAAALIVRSLDRLLTEPPGTAAVKVLSSGQGTTIGALLSLTRQAIGRPPLIVQAASPFANVQARDLSMRSIVWPEVDKRARVSMLDGISRTYLELLQLHCRPRKEAA